jgi:hypothetical protein
MYGLVNRALQQMLIAQHGQEKWETIKASAGVEEDIFISNEAYPDEVTYKIAGTAAEAVQIPVEELLFSLGKYWVHQIAAKHYSNFMDAGGQTFLQFLHNLPNLHNRILLVFPQLKPPEFEIGESGSNFVRLHYFSHREGLTPLVKGLLCGLAEYFHCESEVSLIVEERKERIHNEFLIEWKTKT